MPVCYPKKIKLESSLEIAARYGYRSICLFFNFVNADIRDHKANIQALSLASDS